MTPCAALVHAYNLPTGSSAASISKPLHVVVVVFAVNRNIEKKDVDAAEQGLSTRLTFAHCLELWFCRQMYMHLLLSQPNHKCQVLHINQGVFPERHRFEIAAEGTPLADRRRFTWYTSCTGNSRHRPRPPRRIQNRRATPAPLARTRRRRY